MAKEKIIVVGAGGHSRAVLDILLSNDEYSIYGLLDNAVNIGSVYNIPHLGGDELFESIYNEGVHKAFIAIGDNTNRKRNFLLMEKLGFDFINTISSNAYVSSRAVIGRGVAIMHGAVVNTSVCIGDGTIINTMADVEHDSVVGSFAHIAPRAVLCGGTTVGDEAFICAGTTIKQCLQIGARSIVAIGAAVIKDIPNDVIAAGVPASIKNTIHKEDF